MYRKRVFGIRPVDDEQKPISLFHNRCHNQLVAEVRTQETDSGVNLGFCPLSQTTLYELDISLKDTVSDAKPDLVTCLSGVARFQTVDIADVSSSSLHGQPL